MVQGESIENQRKSSQLGADGCENPSTAGTEPLKLAAGAERTDQGEFCFCLTRVFLKVAGAFTIALLVFVVGFGALQSEDGMEILEKYGFKGAYPATLAAAIILGLANLALVVGACIRHRNLIYTYMFVATIFTVVLAILICIVCHFYLKSGAEQKAVFVGVAIGAVLVPLLVAYVVMMMASIKYVGELNSY